MKEPKIKICPACGGEYVHGKFRKINGVVKKVCTTCSKRLKENENNIIEGVN